MRHPFLFAFIALLIAPVLAYAQVDATLTLSPENPSPYDNVTVTLASYSIDVNTATITWKVGTKTILSGLGQKSLTLALGGVGQSVPVSVQAIGADGSSVTEQITISPESVDLLYEGVEGYVPPMYEGRALAAEGSNVKVVALPSVAENGKVVSPANLSYSWYVDGDLVDNVSGIGKSSIILPLASLSGSTAVRVLVRSPLGNSAEKELTIYPHDILPTLYKYDDLLGTDLTQALDKRLEITGDITLSLQPYYLSTRGMESTADYSWLVDNMSVTPPEKTRLSLHPKENSYGSHYLTVTASQSNRLTQQAETSVQVLFDTRK